MDKDIICTFCQNNVSVAESEFNEHMRAVHDVTTHLDILLALHFVTKLEKDSIVFKHKQAFQITGSEDYFTCIFCNIDHQGQVFSLDKLHEVNLHFEENHAIFNEHEFILPMHVIEDLSEIEKVLLLVGNPLKCPKCNKSFTATSSWELHKKMHKENNTTVFSKKSEKNHCAQCHKRFTTAVNLKYHMLGHTGEKPLSCLDCGAKFKISTHLKRHMFIHTAEKPYKCKVCEAAYTSLHALKYHIATHTGEKPFGCTQCKRFFRSASQLKTHKLFHTGEKPFACNQCEKTFSQAGNLKTHNFFHLGERPFVCTLCDKTYLSSCDLKRHNLRHSGEKLFSCKQCQKSFSWKHGLKKHNQQRRKL